MTTIQLPTPPVAIGITPEEFERTPDTNTAELIDGRIVEKQVSADSAETEVDVATVLKNFVRRNPIAKVFGSSLGYKCFQALKSDPTRIRKPDCTVVKLDRINALPRQNPGLMPIVPDLAVEVLSPNDTAYEIATKIKEYQLAGFPLIWVVDPEVQTVAVYPLTGRTELVRGDDELRAESVLPGFVCKVADLFPVSVPPSSEVENRPQSA